MNETDFNSQIDRLKGSWPSSFPAEKVKLIWTAVYQLPIKWFTKLVTDMIANNRMAPLPAEFILAANQKTKQEYFGSIPTRLDQIHPSENSMFSKQDILEMFTMMRKRLAGEITFKELDQYAKMIENAVKDKKSCAQCDDGIVWKHSSYDNPTVYKCRCQLGQKRLENWKFSQASNQC